MANSEDTCFFRALLRHAAGSPLREKILLAPSNRVGRQWLDRVAAAAGGSAGIRVATPARLIMDYAGPELSRRYLRPLAPPDKVRLAGMALSALSRQQPDDGYFARLSPGDTLAHTIAASLEELEDAGIGNGATWGNKLVSREKADELTALRRRYRAAKRDAGLAGPADIAAAAVKTLRRLQAGGAELPLLLVPDSLSRNLTARERRVFAAWPEELQAPLPEDDESIPADTAFFRADSPQNEVREVLRRIQAERLPLDEVEIVCVDTAGYLPVLCDIAAGYFGGRVEDAPFTFSAGIPGCFAKPVRLVLAWLAWLEEGMPPAGLADMLDAGLSEEGWRETAPGISSSLLAARLKALPVNGGPGDYRRVLGQGADEEMRRAEEWLARWLSATTPLANGGEDMAAQDAAQVLACADALLARPLPDEGKLDAYARRALRDAIDLWRPVAAWDGFDAVKWLRSTALALRTMGLGPAPGRAHVSDIPGGGHCGRGWTFVIGLDDSRHPGVARQDPVLLDKERLRISGKLPLSSVRRDGRERELGRFLARLGGRVTFSYASGDGLGREAQPAALYRRLRGAAPEERAVLRPGADGKCLDRRDDWLWTVLAEPANRLTPAALSRRRPFLAAGDEALRARLSSRFTRWDGLVPEAGADYAAEGWVLSPSQLEMLGRSPLDFFFRKVLGVRPPDRYEVLPGRWLKGNERGDLLHTLFQEFMTRVAGDGMAVTVENGPLLRLLLLDGLADALRRRRRRTPPRDELAYERDKRDMEEACVIFLHEELARAPRARPLAFEAALGGAAADAAPWQRVNPVDVALPGGGRVLLQGRVDRIDRLHADGGLEIVDYKTGRASGFSRQDPFRGGRQLQPLLYTEMLERVLAEAGLPEPVRRFSYFFPMRREQGNAIPYERGDLRGGLEIVGKLCRMLAAGVFPLATLEDDVAVSDFRAAYGGEAKALCAASRGKAANEPLLGDWRELRAL